MNPVLTAQHILGNVGRYSQHAIHNALNNYGQTQAQGVQAMQDTTGLPLAQSIATRNADPRIQAMNDQNVMGVSGAVGGNGTKFIRVGGKLVDQATLTAEQLAKRQFGLNLQRKVADLVDVTQNGGRNGTKLVPDTIKSALNQVNDAKAGRPIFRGVQKDVNDFAPSAKGAFKEYGFSVSPDKKVAKLYGDKVVEGYLKPDAKIKLKPDVLGEKGKIGYVLNDNEIKQAQKEGYDALEFLNKDDEHEILIFNKNAVAQQPKGVAKGGKK